MLCDTILDIRFSWRNFTCRGPSLGMGRIEKSL
jgi:hypothetical protein